MNKLLRFVVYLLFTVVLFVLLYAYAMFQGGFVSWFLFFSFSPIFLYQMGLLFYPMHRWRVKRILSHGTIQSSESITVTIKVTRKFPFPLYYCMFEEVVPLTLQRMDQGENKYYDLNDPSKWHDQRHIKEIVFPWFRRHIELSYSLKHIPRGEHQFHQINVRTGDVFGFIKRTCIFKTVDTLIAYPCERQIHMHENTIHSDQGTNTSQLFHLKHTNVVSSVREYVPGDKISWIDWKQTARNHVIMTKEFEKEKNADALLILNGCGGTNMNPLAFEGAVEVAFSIVEELKRQAANVEFLSIGKKIVYLQGDKGGRRGEIRQHLTRTQPCSKHSFATQLLKQLTNIQHHSMIMILTTYLDQTFYESVQKIKKQTNKVIVLFIQSEHLISPLDLDMSQQLKLAGIMTGLLTEKELVTTPIEVNISWQK